MLGMEQLSPDDRNVVGRARRLERFLTQPFFATEQFSGIPGKDVSLKDGLDGCERILNDEFKDYPGERALYDRDRRRSGREAESRAGFSEKVAPIQARTQRIKRELTLNRRSIPSKLPMHLKILLPTRVFADKPDVSRIVAETPHGSFGLLPHRLDCVAALAPGILIYETPGDGEVFLAVDEGVLVKTGPDVLVSVRRAVGGKDLGVLHKAVEQEFLTLERARTKRALGHG